MKKHVVFDLGQVLINWYPERAFAGYFDSDSALRDWMARVDFDGWNRAQDGGRSLADSLVAIREAHGDAAGPLTTYAERFALTISDPVPGGWEIAEALKSAGHRLFAITNWAAHNWPAALETYPRLTTLFEDIVVSGIESQLKPEPEIYLTLTSRNAIAPEDCIFIDDSPRNVEGARAVGMDAIHFTGAPALREALARRGIG